MQFDKYKRVRSIFLNHYNAMYNIAKSSSLAHNFEFELLPAMFIISDYATASADNNRIAVANEIERTIDSMYSKINYNSFWRRCTLYGEIIRGKKLRAEWYFGDIAILNDNAVSKCVALLGDILVNPDYADNYDTAPMVIHDIFDVMEFADSVIKPLFSEMVSLFKEIYDL